MYISGKEVRVHILLVVTCWQLQDLKITFAQNQKGKSKLNPKPSSLIYYNCAELIIKDQKMLTKAPRSLGTVI